MMLHVLMLMLMMMLMLMTMAAWRATRDKVYKGPAPCVTQRPQPSHACGGALESLLHCARRLQQQQAAQQWKSWEVVHTRVRATAWYRHQGHTGTRPLCTQDEGSQHEGSQDEGSQDEGSQQLAGASPRLLGLGVLRCSGRAEGLCGLVLAGGA